MNEVSNQMGLAQPLKSGWIAAFAVASCWFGTHVGGGFASGNQVVSFFGQYGSYTVIFPLLAMGLLAVAFWIITMFSKVYGYKEYKQTFSALYPHPKMEYLFEVYYLIIVFAAVAAAVAGAGNVLANMLGVNYDLMFNKVLFNLLITAILIILIVFGVKIVVAASTLLSVAIIIISVAMIVVGLTVDYEGIASQVMAYYNVTDFAKYTHSPATSIIRGIFVYAGFQALSIPVVIAASKDLSFKGVKRFAVLGGILNGFILAGSVAMLSKWYPLIAALKDIGDFGNTLSIPNQTVLGLIGMKWLTSLFGVLCLCAFISTCVTLVYTLTQRFRVYFFPKKIKSVGVRSFFTAAIIIGLCFLISLMGLSSIVNILYSFDGYIGFFVVIIPAFIWGIPKLKKGLKDQKKTIS